MKDMTVALPRAVLVLVAVAATPPVTFPSPPPGCHPRTATPGQLARYGVPARPRGGAGLKAWERALRALHLSKGAGGAGRPGDD